MSKRLMKKSRGTANLLPIARFARDESWLCTQDKVHRIRTAVIDLTEFRIILRSSDLECGSPAAAFLIDPLDSIVGEAQ